MTTVQRMIDPELTGTACIITGDLLETIHAKTAHGLIRESKRFEIVGVIDNKAANRDAGEVLDGQYRNIPILSSIAQLIEKNGNRPEYAIIGMATKGGILPPSLYPVISEVLSHGIHIVNGLHQPLSGISELSDLAKKNEAILYDIRKPKPFEDLHFWDGKIQEVNCLKIGVLGTDCSIGKRTTTKLLNNALNQAGIKSEMIFTGQTGWLQGTKYGFIFDATPNDFIPGELENAMYSCWKNEQPEVMLIEGQASLKNPGGPCGSEFIVSGRLDGVILQHHPIRTHYSNLEYFPATIPDALEDVKIIELLGCDTWALTVNTADMTAAQISASKEDLATRSGLPVVSPLVDGMGGLVEVIKRKMIKV
ncbi:DUF1611 domain-containing protein [Fulvivirgaceae bacterium BMA12]|uniref:DUF1611 domain-containing protein n=1 Tax=Agaribacillus aureus TaxID=3051825 RepID=A0ABT8LB51_9BACT|nr:DUF1611 domain-containing protein [Fulvivirgaceae bacterium BMA12]